MVFKHSIVRDRHILPGFKVFLYLLKQRSRRQHQTLDHNSAFSETTDVQSAFPKLTIVPCFDNSFPLLFQQIAADETDATNKQ